MDKTIIKLTAFDFVCFLLAGVFFGAFFNLVVCYSFILGACVFFIPYLYFALYAVRKAETAFILLSIYRGQVGKFVLTCLGFATVFLLVKPINIFSVFSGFTLATLIQNVLVAYQQNNLNQ